MTKPKKSMRTFGVLSIIGLFFFICVTANAAAPAGTISYWKLDEADTFDPTDAETYEDSVSTNEGASTGTSPTESPAPVAGRVGVGQLFGSDTGINIPVGTALDFLATDSFTIECWVKGPAAPPAGTQVFIGREDPAAAAGALEMWVGIRDTGRAAFRLTSGAESFTVEGETTVIDDSKFYHVVAVRDASLNQNRLYVDGVLDTAAPLSATYTNGFASTVELNIGQLLGGAHFVGALDEIAIYNRTLSPAEIVQHFNAGNNGVGIDPPAPPAGAPASTISYWKLDEADTFDPTDAETYEDSVSTNEGASTGTSPTESPAPAAGRVGVGQLFGSDTGINIPVGTALDFQATNSFTIECWVKGPAAPPAGTQVFIGREDPAAAAGALEMWVGIRDTGRAAFRLTSGAESFTVEGETTVIDDSKFYHVVAVRDASLNQNRLYVDGVLDTAAPLSATYTNGFASTVELNIGQLLGGAHFVGALDEIAIYNKALTATEIDEHYQTGLAGNGIDTLGGVPEIIGTLASGIKYWDVAKSTSTQMTSDVTTGDIAAGDFNGDGIADVASSWADYGLWYQDGATLEWFEVDKLPPMSVTAGDVTGDGRDEIIGTWFTGNANFDGIWYFNFVTSTWTRMTPDVGAKDIAAGDFNGDGFADVASTWEDFGLYYQDGATLAWILITPSPSDSVTAGDVTGDGRDEIIGTWFTGIAADDGIWYWDLVTSTWTRMTPDVGAKDIAAGDFDADGKADVASTWDDYGLWYQNGATSAWTKVDDLPAFRVTAGDVTGD